MVLRGFWMTLGFLLYVTCCNQSENQSVVYNRAKCGLTQVPTDIPRTTERVLLYSNNIKKIDKGAFSYLTQCTFLNVQNNELTQLRRGMFAGLHALESLVLSSNYIGTIQTRTFFHLKRCTHLWLNENKLTHIRSGMFEGLKSLNKLILSQNIISKIQPGSFADLLRLNALILSKNDLKTLDRNVFHSQYQTRLYLEINGNPLLCDCRMCWIKQGEREEWLLIHHTDKNGGELYKPECVNYPGVDWDVISLTCPEEENNGSSDHHDDQNLNVFYSVGGYVGSIVAVVMVFTILIICMCLAIFSCGNKVHTLKTSNLHFSKEDIAISLQ